MPPKKEDKLLKEVNELEAGGKNNALLPDEEEKKAETPSAQTTAPEKAEVKPEEPKKEEPQKAEPAKTEVKKEEPEVNPLTQGIIDDKSRAEAEKKAEKERKAKEKEEQKRQKEIEKAKKKEEKAKKKAEEAELSRRKAESDQDTYADVPPNPGFWRTLFSFLKKLVTGTGLKDVDDYFAAKLKADRAAEKKHKAIEDGYKKELEKKLADAEKQKEKTEPELEKTEPEKKQAETEKKQPEVSAPEKETEKKQDAPEKKEVAIDLTTHGETKQNEGEKKDLEKMTPEERANIRVEKFIQKNFPDKGKNLTPTQKENLKRVFQNAEVGRDNMQQSLDEAVKQNGEKAYVPKGEKNMQDFIAGKYLEQYAEKHPERRDQLLQDMEKPHFAESFSKATNNCMNVYFLSQSRLNAQSMKAYLSEGDKLTHVVETLDKAIGDKRSSPTFQDDVKKAQDKLKTKVEVEKKKIEEKEKKLNDTTMDKEKQKDTIQKGMAV